MLWMQNFAVKATAAWGMLKFTHIINCDVATESIYL